MCRLMIKVSTSCYNDSWEETTFAAVTKKECHFALMQSVCMSQALF